MAKLLRLIPLVALGVALAGPSNAGASNSELKQFGQCSCHAQDSQIDAPFLWQVEGAQRPSYLFGTIHLGVELGQLPPVVTQSLERSPVFVMETVPPGLDVQPTSSVGGATGQPMDFELARMARSLRKPVWGLESMALQRALLAQVSQSEGHSPEEFVAMLHDESEELASLVHAYQSGSLSQIEAITGTSDEVIQESLLNNRNRDWLRKLTPLLRRGGAFVAVGVGHMPSEQGILQGLGDAGFTVRRVLG